MYYVTGDIHGEWKRWDLSFGHILNPGDTLIIAGDFGIGFFGNDEEAFFDHIAEKKYQVVFCEGNHEDFDKINSYRTSLWNGGRAHVIRKNLIHLMRGEVYEMDGSKFFVMGGGHSSDEAIRRLKENSPHSNDSLWWPEEMPDDEDFRNASANLEKSNYTVDYILTHTAPIDTVKYLYSRGLVHKGYDTEEEPLTNRLAWLEGIMKYKKWYFGHFHTDHALWKNQYVVYNAIRELPTGEIAELRTKKE